VLGLAFCSIPLYLLKNGFHERSFFKIIHILVVKSCLIFGATFSLSFILLSVNWYPSVNMYYFLPLYKSGICNYLDLHKYNAKTNIRWRDGFTLGKEMGKFFKYNTFFIESEVITTIIHDAEWYVKINLYKLSSLSRFYQKEILTRLDLANMDKFQGYKGMYFVSQILHELNKAKEENRPLPLYLKIPNRKYPKYYDETSDVMYIPLYYESQ
jgi:hypothetical protein